MMIRLFQDIINKLSQPGNALNVNEPGRKRMFVAPFAKSALMLSKNKLWAGSFESKLIGEKYVIAIIAKTNYQHRYLSLRIFSP